MSKFIWAVSLAAPALSLAQTNMTIYANSLVNGWSDGSYNVTLNYANTSPVYTEAAIPSASPSPAPTAAFS